MNPNSKITFLFFTEISPKVLSLYMQTCLKLILSESIDTSKTYVKNLQYQSLLWIILILLLNYVYVCLNI